MEKLCVKISVHAYFAAILCYKVMMHCSKMHCKTKNKEAFLTVLALNYNTGTNNINITLNI